MIRIISIAESTANVNTLGHCSVSCNLYMSHSPPAFSGVKWLSASVSSNIVSKWCVWTFIRFRECGYSVNMRIHSFVLNCCYWLNAQVWIITDEIEVFFEMNCSENWTTSRSTMKEERTLMFSVYIKLVLEIIERAFFQLFSGEKKTDMNLGFAWLKKESTNFGVSRRVWLGFAGPLTGGFGATWGDTPRGPKIHLET